MYNDSMATKNHKRVFAKVQEQIANNKPVNISKAMRESGAYSPSSCKNPTILTKTKGWQYLMSRIDDEPYLDRVEQIAFTGKHGDSLKAIEMMFKLKDRFPAGKLKVDQYDSELDAVKYHEADFVEETEENTPQK